MSTPTAEICKSGREDQALFGALRSTISGIAQGLQATG